MDMNTRACVAAAAYTALTRAEVKRVFAMSDGGPLQITTAIVDSEVTVVEATSGCKLSGGLGNLFEASDQKCGWVSMEVRKERFQADWIVGVHNDYGIRFRVEVQEDMVELITEQGNFHYCMNYPDIG